MSFLKKASKSFKVIGEGVSVIKEDLKAIKPIKTGANKVVNYFEDFGGAVAEAQATNSGKPLKQFTHDHRYKAGMIGKGVSGVGKAGQLIGKNLKFVGNAMEVVDPESAEAAEELQKMGKTFQKIGKTVDKGGKKIYSVEKAIQHYFSHGKVKSKHHDHLIATNASYTGEVPEGYTKIDKHSKSGEVVVMETEDGDIHISFTGTDPTNIDDLIADVHILTGTEEDNEQFKKSEELYKRIKAEYPDRKIHLSGHSKGAMQARFVACRHEVESAVTFNIGSNPLVEYERNGDRDCVTKGHHYKTAGDPISVGGYFNENVYIVPQTAGDPHTILNFVDA